MMYVEHVDCCYIDSLFASLAKVVPQPQVVPLMKHASIQFTGRDKYLQELKDYFSSSVGEKRNSFLLYGLGGMGKTQICLKFIEENPSLWVSQ